MRRLGLLIPEFPTQTHIAMWRLGMALRRAGIEVEMLSTRRPEGEGGVHPALIEEAGRTFYCWPARARVVMGEGLRAWWRLPGAVWYALALRESGIKERARVVGMIAPALALRRRARERGLGHVFVHSCASAAHVVALCRVLGGPAYSLRLGGDIDVYGPDQRAKMRRATVVVGAARVNMEQAVARAGVKREGAIWSWLGVETGKYQPGVHAGRGEGAMRMVTVARLNHAKGHRFVLDAMALARTKGVELRYTIVGDGPERLAIEEQVRLLELGGQVELTGSLDEDGVRAALQMAEVFVLPTSGPGEGSPVAVLEAMSAGLAIVASDVGGLREMVGEAEGVIVPTGDAVALCEALVELARESERRRAMGRASRERALREFDVDAVARRLVGYFFSEPDVQRAARDASAGAGRRARGRQTLGETGSEDRSAGPIDRGMGAGRGSSASSLSDRERAHDAA